MCWVAQDARQRLLAQPCANLIACQAKQWILKELCWPETADPRSGKAQPDCQPAPCRAVSNRPDRKIAIHQTAFRTMQARYLTSTIG